MRCRRDRLAPILNHLLILRTSNSVRSPAPMATMTAMRTAAISRKMKMMSCRRVQNRWKLPALHPILILFRKMMVILPNSIELHHAKKLEMSEKMQKLTLIRSWVSAIHPTRNNKVLQRKVEKDKVLHMSRQSQMQNQSGASNQNLKSTLVQRSIQIVCIQRAAPASRNCQLNCLRLSQISFKEARETKISSTSWTVNSQAIGMVLDSC